MLIDNLIKTWGELAPNELDSGPDEMNLNCLNKRGWSWSLSCDSGVRFTATVEDGLQRVFETWPYPTALEALLTAYLTALAARRPIKQGTHWRHYKGGLMEVVGAAHWCGSAATEEDIEPLPKDMLYRGAFILEESLSGTTHLIQYVEAKYFSYIANRDYGERVCYHHDFQNWARPIGDFLGLTQDGLLRFVEESHETN
jgi:hypothetical protein